MKLEFDSEDAAIDHLQTILNYIIPDILKKSSFAKDGALKVDLVHHGSSSTETGYFIFIAGGINLEEKFFENAGVTVSSGEFEPGLYLLHDQPGGAMLLPSHKANEAALTNASSGSGLTRTEELTSIARSFDRYFMARFKSH